LSSDVPVSDELPKRLCVAKIATAHGVRGLVKLHVFAENVDLLNGKLFTGEHGDKTLTLHLKNATAKHWLAEIEGIKDRNDAEKLRGTNLYIDKDALPAPDDGEFYFADLIGLPCFTKEDQKIGKVIAVENYGAGDLLEIQPTGSESFYLPFNDENIQEVLDDKIMMSIPEGLMDE